MILPPDGYYVDANGVWDGNASTVNNKVNLGTGRGRRLGANRYRLEIQAGGRNLPYQFMEAEPRRQVVLLK